MTLDRHRIDGLPKILDQTMPATRFEQLLIDAGYIKIGTAPAKGNRINSSIQIFPFAFNLNVCFIYSP